MNDQQEIATKDSIFTFMKFRLIFILIGVSLITLSASAQETIVQINTDLGEIKVKLYDETKQHKKNFIKLVEQGFYDKTLFHRVINQFMIQGGDPDSKGASDGQLLGNGGPGYTIPAEIKAKYIHKKGALAAARQSDQVNPEKESSGSQFYIVQGRTYSETDIKNLQARMITIRKREISSAFFRKEENASYSKRLQNLKKNNDQQGLRILEQEIQPFIDAEYEQNPIIPYTQDQIEAYKSLGGTPHLDGGYTVFGEVIEGMEVIDKIASVNTSPQDRPLRDIQVSMKILK